MMHGHSPAGKALGFVVGLLVSLAAIIIGLGALKIDFWGYFPQSLHGAVYPLQLIIGVAGVLSLIYLFIACASCGHDSHAGHHHKK